MVIVKIWGGLGNQLFQYSFGKYLSAKLNTPVKYDIQVTNSLSSFVQRDLALSHFDVHIDIATEAEVNEKKYFRNIHLARLERKLAQQFPFLFRQHIVEHNAPGPAGSMHFNDNCYYEGYWQSYNYLTPVESELRKELTIKQSPGQQVAGLLAAIHGSPSAGIHVRRSDYLTHQHFITCDMQYYEKAIQHLQQISPGIKFYIFSDDMPWCKENFTGVEFVFVEGNRHYEDMYLMANCHHNIIANSTFSWWAAWLNSNPQKIIITPGNWHKKKNEKKNELLPDAWIKK